MHTPCGTLNGGCTGQIDCPCPCATCRKAVGTEIKTLQALVSEIAKQVKFDETKFREDLDKVLANSGGGGRSGSAV